MAYSFKGSISFGLVYIPVTLHSCVTNKDISFNMIDKETMSRIKYSKTCVDCDGKEVSSENIVKGYEYEKGKYVIFDDKDFEKIKSKKDKNISIEQFVNISEIDPIYFEKPYYVNPTGAENAFAVLLFAMEKEGKAAIARTVLGTKETLVAIRAQNGQMLLNTLYFKDEISKNPAERISIQPKENELKIAKAIVDGMTDKFDIGEFKDEYREKVLAAIEQKVEGKEIVASEETKGRRVTDLMEALTASLAELRNGGENSSVLS